MAEENSTLSERTGTVLNVRLTAKVNQESTGAGRVLSGGCSSIQFSSRILCDKIGGKGNGSIKIFSKIIFYLLNYIVY